MSLRLKIGKSPLLFTPNKYCIRFFLFAASKLESVSKKMVDELSVWHKALAKSVPQEEPLKFLLPTEHREGSHKAAVFALLGDALLKCAVLRELAFDEAGDVKRGAHVGEITPQSWAALSNKTLSAVAVEVLVFPGGAVQEEEHLKLSPHNRATAVEAAVALVHRAEGDVPIACLARYLLRLPEVVNAKDWLSILNQSKGTTTAAKDDDGQWSATATLSKGMPVYHSPRSYNKQSEAKAAAAEVLLRATFDDASDVV